jgi:hypothetical protein
MTPQTLRELLARVHEHLRARGGSIDGESQRKLSTVMRDLERTLDDADKAPDDASSTAAAHTPRLESLAVRFEAGHPALAETLRELIDALVKAGI